MRKKYQLKNPHNGYESILESDNTLFLNRLSLERNLSCNNYQEKTKILDRTQLLQKKGKDLTLNRKQGPRRTPTLPLNEVSISHWKITIINMILNPLISFQNKCNISKQDMKLIKNMELSNEKKLSTI